MSKYLLIFSMLFFLACKEEETPLSADEMLSQMEAIDTEIEAMLVTSCSSSSQCMATAYGAKACGGPVKYIVHSTEMDMPRFLLLVNRYNSLNAQYNLETGAISDCSIIVEPDVECVSGECQPVADD